MRTTCFIILITSIIVCGCNPNLIPLKEKYSNDVIEITSTKPGDTVWSKITGIFTTNGLPLKIADKDKGTIRTKSVRLNAMYTFEDSDGRLEQPQAWVVLPKVFNKNKEWKPKDISGQWSILVSESGKGISTIKIDPVVICTYFPNSFTKVENRGQSTGKLEELIRQSLKDN